MELKVGLDDLKPEYREIVDIIGFDQFIGLVERFGGFQLYIPKPDSLVRNERNELIKSEFNGFNFRDLAQRYGLTERHIREIVSPVVKQVRNRPMDGQESFFQILTEQKD